jgi:HSP20 family molecular chaperone IbpA
VESNYDHKICRSVRRLARSAKGAGGTLGEWLAPGLYDQPRALPADKCVSAGRRYLAIIELPGIDKNDLQIQAKENTIRIAGQKSVEYPDGVSVHRRERVCGEFDRTLSLPVQLDPDRIKAEYQDGILALFLPRAERDKPRTIAIK